MTPKKQLTESSRSKSLELFEDGMIDMENEDWKFARDNFECAIELRRKLRRSASTSEDTDFISRCKKNLEVIYLKLALTQQELGHKYFGKREFSAARHAFKRSIDFLNKLETATDTDQRLRFSVLFELAVLVYDATGETEKEIAAYVTAIEELNIIPNKSKSADDFRHLFCAYLNLYLCYEQFSLFNHLAIRINMLERAIASLQRISANSKTPNDKRDIALTYFKLAKELVYSPEIVKECQAAIDAQEETAYRADELATEMKIWREVTAPQGAKTGSLQISSALFQTAAAAKPTNHIPEEPKPGASL